MPSSNDTAHDSANDSANDSSVSRPDSRSRPRERFKPEEPSSPVRSWSSLPRRVGRFLMLSAKKAQADNLSQEAAALAFITLVSLIPLLTAFSVIGARAFERQAVRPEVGVEADVEADGSHESGSSAEAGEGAEGSGKTGGDGSQVDVMIQLLTQVLPYSEEALLSKIEDFLKNARALSGLGFVIFLITALTAFSTIDQTINRIWNVPHHRPLRWRLWSFTLLLFWGPLLIGATYSALFVLEDSATYRAVADSIPAQAIPLVVPFLVTLLGLTMLYWLVPYTAVYFPSALTGGVVTALLLEGLRKGFQFYISKATAVSFVYGSLGGVFFFIVSVHLTWWIVLLGAEVAYCTQHHSTLTRERRRAAPFDGAWMGLLALVTLYQRLRAGEPITPHERLADRLRLPSNELLAVLEPLLSEGLVRETAGDNEGFLLARDAHELRLAEVFDLYEAPHWELLDAFPQGPAGELESLRAALAKARDREVGKAVLAALVDGTEREKEPENKPGDGTNHGTDDD